MLAMNVHEGVLYYRTFFSEVHVVVAYFQGDGRVGQTLDQILINGGVTGQNSILESKQRDGFTKKVRFTHKAHLSQSDESYICFDSLEYLNVITQTDHQ